MSDLDLIGPSEAARILTISERTVARWADAGRLPIAETRPSGQRRFSRTVVQSLLGEAAE